VLVLVLGLGSWSAYTAAFVFRLPAVFFMVASTPPVMLLAAFLAFAIVAVPVGVAGASRSVWVGVPLGCLLVAAVVFAAVSAWALRTPLMWQPILQSDLPVALLSSVAAFAGSRVPNKRFNLTRRAAM
jgi:uncharacterized membrane protein YjdF